VRVAQRGTKEPFNRADPKFRPVLARLAMLGDEVVIAAARCGMGLSFLASGSYHVLAGMGEAG